MARDKFYQEQVVERQGNVFLGNRLPRRVLQSVRAFPLLGRLRVAMVYQLA